MSKKEAQARIKINKLLENAKWRFFNNDAGKANIVLENNVKISESRLNAFGNNFEYTTSGYIDFLLLDSKGFPLVVLEAKREDKNPLDGKEQARRYAKSCNARYVILSNGNLHYFWDLEKGNPNIITSFPTQESLEKHRIYKPNPNNLINEVVNEDYIAITQKPDYLNDPRWIDVSLRNEIIDAYDLKFLRPYQLKAIRRIQSAVKNGKDRFLLEMATGSGKTLLAAAVIKLFLRTSNAKRVLFLVDRLELEDQARKNFIRYLKNDFKTVIYKENRDDWSKAEIVVTTVQSLMFNNKYNYLFSPTDFDFIISDEAHRSIGGNTRALFEYFVGYKLGLTATPKNYLKNIDPEKLNTRDPRALERRMLLDTYKTFGCERGIPSFRYSLIDAVKDGYLVNPIVVDARTEITTQLLSEEGYAVMLENEEGEDTQEFYHQRDFEKKFYSEETNKILCKTFIENALKDPVSGEIGKSIVYCVSQKHASKITQILNIFADRVSPGKYNSDFAVQVTSNIPHAQQHTISFSNNNLNSETKFLEGYKSSKTRACVTVGMMTTGYDCQDIVNLCLLRPIFSPTDFIQIKGRGTRKFTFNYKFKNDQGEIEQFQKEKEKYKLFDFFANCEYFEEEYNYDEILELPPLHTQEPVEGPVPPIPKGYDYFDIDPLKSLEEFPVGLKGMKVDRMSFDKFENTVKKNVAVIDFVNNRDFKAAENYVIEKLFDKPEDYFNLEKLQKATQVNRRLTLREILEKIFGLIPYFKSKEQLLEEEFEKFISVCKPEPEYILPIKNFLKSYIIDRKVRDIIESKKYSNLATYPIYDDFRALNNKWRRIIPEYVKNYVPINTFL